MCISPPPPGPVKHCISKTKEILALPSRSNKEHGVFLESTLNDPQEKNHA